MDFILICLLIGIHYYSNPVAARPLDIHSDLSLCILKMLKKDKLNDIGIVYGSKQLNEYTVNEWWISYILENTSSERIPLQVTRAGKVSKRYSTVQIIFLDSLEIDEVLWVKEQFAKRVKRLIFLARYGSDDFIETLGVWKKPTILVSYTNEEVIFSKLAENSQLEELFRENELFTNASCEGTLFPEDSLDLSSQAPLTLLIRNDPPFVIIKSDENGTEYTGYLIDLWDHIAEGLNLRYIIKEFKPKKGQDFWDSWNNGFKNEMNKSFPEIALYATIDTMDFQDPTYTGILTGISFRLCLYERKNHMDYWDFIRSVSQYTIAAIIVIAIISLLILYAKGTGLAESTFSILAITLNQGKTSLQRSNSARLTIVSFTILVMVFSLLCTVSLISLSIYGKVKPTTGDDVMNDPGGRVGFVEYCSGADAMRDTRYFKILERLDLSGYDLIKSIPMAFEKIINDGIYVFVEQERVNPYFDKYECCILESPIDVPRLPARFLIRRNIKFRKIISHEVSKLMEYGIITKLRNKWWPEIYSHDKVFIPVTVDELSTLFHIFFLGMLIALFTFFIERRAGIARR